MPDVVEFGNNALIGGYLHQHSQYLLAAGAQRVALGKGHKGTLLGVVLTTHEGLGELGDYCRGYEWVALRT